MALSALAAAVTVAHDHHRTSVAVLKAIQVEEEAVAQELSDAAISNMSAKKGGDGASNVMDEELQKLQACHEPLSAAVAEASAKLTHARAMLTHRQEVVPLALRMARESQTLQIESPVLFRDVTSVLSTQLEQRRAMQRKVQREETRAEKAALFDAKRPPTFYVDRAASGRPRLRPNTSLHPREWQSGQGVNAACQSAESSNPPPCGLCVWGVGSRH